MANVANVADMADVAAITAADQEIAVLEERLRIARQRRQQLGGAQGLCLSDAETPPDEAQQQQQHFLLLLSDSALPLGSFAFSSGLESFLAHDKTAAAAADDALASVVNVASVAAARGPRSGPDAFAAFLPLSVLSYAHTSLPFVLAAHDAAAAAVKADPVSASVGRAPDPLTAALVDLDDTFDATIICTVGRRASVAQGRALLSVWERAFAPVLAPAGPLSAPAATAPNPAATAPNPAATAPAATAADPLRPFARLVKRSSNPPPGTLAPASAHLAPLFGAVAALAGLGRRQTADVFVLAHVKALLSAAVRASLVGPYQAQRLLASTRVQHLVARAVAGAWALPVDAAGQTAPVLDLWMGRHELLYSRIFNS